MEIGIHPLYHLQLHQKYELLSGKYDKRCEKPVQ